MIKEFFWMSDECALYNRTRFAKPDTKTVYRFKRSPSGNGFALQERRRSDAAIQDAPGYTTAVYLPTGDVIHFTESMKEDKARSLYKDARFVGEFDPRELVILQHKDGYAAKYQVGSGGLQEHELTIYQAKWLEDACAEAGLPMPMIEGYELTRERAMA